MLKMRENSSNGGESRHDHRFRVASWARLLLNLEQPLARAADAPEPWATDVRDLVGLVRSLSSELVAAGDELARLRHDTAARDDSS